MIQFEILKACSFDFFQTETVYKAIFGYGDSESFSDALDEAEIQGSIFILLIGPVFLFIVLYTIYILVHTVCNYLFKGGQVKSNCMNKFIQPKGFTNVFIIFLLEGCVELGISCGVCFSIVSQVSLSIKALTSHLSVHQLTAARISSFSEIFSTSLGFVMAVALIVAPFYIFVAGNRLYKAK